MSRNRLAVFLVAMTWISAICGSVLGGSIAQLRVSGSLIPNLEILRFAAGWGLVWGLIPAGVAMAILAESKPGANSLNVRWLAGWLAVGLATGLSFYVVAVISASI
jgi:hypothetical protein